MFSTEHLVNSLYFIFMFLYSNWLDPFSSPFHTEIKSSKPEPGEVSPLHSSTSSKKEGSLKRARGSQEMNDSEEDGDLLEDEDEVSPIILLHFCSSIFL